MGFNHMAIRVIQIDHPSRLEWEVKSALDAVLKVPTERQVAACGTFLDIAIPTHMIAIEIDDPSHYGAAAKKKNAERDAKLNRKGWSVFRLREDELGREGGVQAVVQVIALIVESMSDTATFKGPYEYRADYFQRKANERKAKKLKKKQEELNASNPKPRARPKPKPSPEQGAGLRGSKDGAPSKPRRSRAKHGDSIPGLG